MKARKSTAGHAQHFLPAQFQLLVTGIGVLVLLLFFPGGLGQILYTVRDNYLRWVAARRGLVVPSLVADKRVEEEIDLSEEEDRPEDETAVIAGALS